jgi:toxin ParE1/3/4
MARQISDTVETLLSENPEIGRPGRVRDTRELVVARTPFIVAYRIRPAVVEIVRVLHGAQRWPDQL